MNLRLKMILPLLGAALISATSALAQKHDTFKVVLDAGHGGSGKGGDPGAIGNGLKEKDITLDVALKVGEILNKHKDIKVIYTRKTDVFIPLDQRPRIANKENADIFVSIHCNAVANPQPKGTETFVLGVSRDKHNIEVAKRENSVIFLEDNYKEKYQGYDPNNPQSVIGLMHLQGEYKNQSILLASAIQKDFTNRLKRNNRGVKEAGFLVLRDCAMPSILVEIGFISNKDDASYIGSEAGQNEVAHSIANAIINYKNDHYSSSDPFQYIAPEPTPKSTHNDSAKTAEKSAEISTTVDTSKPIFKVQIASSKNSLKLVAQNFHGLSPISSITENEIHRYYYGQTNDYQQAKTLLEQAKEAGYKDAFIVGFKNDKIVKLSEIIK